MKLHLEIVTPEKKVYEGEADEVICPTTQGEVAILPNHVNFVTQIAPGEIIIKQQGKEDFIAIMGGFLELTGNKISVIGDYAVRSENIETAKAEEAKKRAEKAMEEKTSQKDLAIAETQLRRSLLELKISQRRKRSTSQ